MKKKYVIGIVISAVCLYLVFRNVDLKKLAGAFSQAHYLWTIPTILLSFLSYFLRAWRWQFFFPGGERPPYRRTLSATMIGFMANNLLPARIGEIVRAYVLGKKCSIPVTYTFATIVIERIFDTLTMLIVFGFVLVYDNYQPLASRLPMPNQVTSFAWLALAICILAIIVLVLLYYRKLLVLGIIDWIIRPLPEKLRIRIRNSFDTFSAGLNVLASGKSILIITILSFTIWLVLVGSVYSIFIAFDFNQAPFELNPLIAVFLLVLFAGGVAIPSGPAFVGTFHGVAVFGLGIFNIPKQSALAFAIVMHGISFIPVTLIGLLFLMAEGMSFSEISAAKGTATRDANGVEESQCDRSDLR